MKWVTLQGKQDYNFSFSDETIVFEYFNFYGTASVKLEDSRLIELAKTKNKPTRIIDTSGQSKIISFLKNGNYTINVKTTANSSVTLQAAFLVDEDSSFNYTSEHLFGDSSSTLELHSLIRNAKKTSNLKIQIHKGAINSEASEKEISTLLSENAINLSIPSVYCNEESVSVKHSLSCGHIDDSQKTYLNTRGLSDSEIKKMLVISQIRSLSSSIKDRKILKYIEDLIANYV